MFEALPEEQPQTIYRLGVFFFFFLLNSSPLISSCLFSSHPWLAVKQTEESLLYCTASTDPVG